MRGRTPPAGLAAAPPPGAPVPRAMLDAAGGEVELVWRNEAGGLTGLVAGAGRYVKWNPAGSGESLAAEAERLDWLRGRHPAPEVLELRTIDGDELLVTAALPGRSAVASEWAARPDAAIRAIAAGLRRLHALPVSECPFDWGVETRLAEAGIRAAGALGPPPPIDRPVVCHGDPCAPNTLLGAEGEFLAHVDLGRLGVADRWADLAVATMSFDWNYADADAEPFWEVYGVPPDAERIAYYRALWDGA